MHTTTVGVDLAKSTIQVAVADERYRVTRRLRLTRARFEAFLAQHPTSLFVMEACGSSQHWGRKLQALGHDVKLLPAQYVRAYVKRNKTDAADAAALIEASRTEDIRPVPIKTLDQQQILLLHRMREQYKQMRVAKINLLRGCLREVGIDIPKGVARGLEAIRDALALADNGLPDALRPWIAQCLAEITAFKQHTLAIERELKTLLAHDPLVARWLEVYGIGLLSATALRAAAGDLTRFPSGRHLASWLGVTAREHSSGEKRRLGGISKRGDAYLRSLLVHGARAALHAAKRARHAGQPVDPLRTWALEVEQRRGTNKATIALANKLARILWAMARYDRPFDANYSRKAA
jgi:transposase